MKNFLFGDVSEVERGVSVSLPFLLVLLFYYTLFLSGWLLMKAEGLWLVD
jgi:hypothetical protein